MSCLHLSDECNFFSSRKYIMRYYVKFAVFFPQTCPQVNPGFSLLSCACPKEQTKVSPGIVPDVTTFNSSAFSQTSQMEQGNLWQLQVADPWVVKELLVSPFHRMG